MNTHELSLMTWECGTERVDRPTLLVYVYYRKTYVHAPTVGHACSIHNISCSWVSWLLSATVLCRSGWTAIVLELEHWNIISSDDQKTISWNKNATQAQLLRVYLKKTCDLKALMDVCDIITKVKSNPRMKLFEEEMKMEWEKGACSPSMC